MRALHPERSADEIRTSIELSAGDRGRPGWDINYGAGLLDAEKSLRHPGGGIIEISSPRSDSGSSRTGSIAIIGSIAYPTLDRWELSVGEGEIPDQWTRVNDGSEALLNALLGTVDAASLADTVVTIRLVGISTSGRSIERRTRLFSDDTPPSIIDFSVRPIWMADRRAVAATFRTDDLTTAELRLTPIDGSSGAIIIEREEGKVGFTRQHYWFIKPDEATPGVRYRAELIVRNAAGLGTNFIHDELIVSAESAPLSSMRPIDRRLPFGFLGALDTTRRIDGRGDLLLMNRFVDLSFDKLLLYEIGNGAFLPIDSAGNLVPRGFGDIDGDGLSDVLTQAENRGIIYEQISRDGSPFASILFADTTSGRFSPAALRDMNGDGRDELIYYTNDDGDQEEYYVVAEWNGQRFEERARFSNPTSPGRLSASNVLGASDPLIDDLNGDGRLDFCFGDNDGDLVLYIQENDGTFRLEWFDENDGEDIEKMIASGDLEGDGRRELFVAWRPSLLMTRENEYHPPLWQLRGYAIEPSGEPKLIASEEFAYVRTTRLFRTGIALGDLDDRPGDELALSLFPNAFVFRWDPTTRRLQPFWFSDGSIINRPIIIDSDDDGINEMAVGDGDVIEFVEADDRSLTLLPPAGIDGWSVSGSANVIRWDSVEGVTVFRLYRRNADSIGVPLRLIAETSETMFVDNGEAPNSDPPQSGIAYHYLVTAVNADDLESVGSERITVVTHEPVRPIGATAISSQQIRVTMSQPLAQSLYRTGALSVVTTRDGRVEVDLSSVLNADAITLVVTLDAARAGEELELRATSLLRDAYGSPADTTIVLRVTMLDEEPTDPFIATSAYAGEGKRIILTFSEPVDPSSVTSIGSYRIEPDGTILSAAINPANPREVVLILADDYPLGPYGFRYTIAIDGVRSIDGETIRSGPGSIVGFTISATNLEELFVFPQPYSLREGKGMTFAGLPSNGFITIHTQSGLILHQIAFDRGEGGVQWDGRLPTGDPLPTGIYLYFITVLDESGEEGERRVGKFAVVP